jgi:hypothetical protein
MGPPRHGKYQCVGRRSNEVPQVPAITSGRTAGTVRYARALTGVEHVHAVLGGFDLTGKVFEPIIRPTVDGLAINDFARPWTSGSPDVSVGRDHAADRHGRGGQRPPRVFFEQVGAVERAVGGLDPGHGGALIDVPCGS